LPHTKQTPSGVSIEAQAGGAGLWEASEVVGAGAAAAATYAAAVAPADKKSPLPFYPLARKTTCITC